MPKGRRPPEDVQADIQNVEECVRTGECNDGGLLLSRLYAEIPRGIMLEAKRCQSKCQELSLTVSVFRLS